MGTVVAALPTLGLVAVAVALELLRGPGPREGHRGRGGPLFRPARRDGLRHRVRLRAGERRRGRAAAGRDGPLRRLDVGAAREGGAARLRRRGGGRGCRGRGDARLAARAPGGAGDGPLPHTARGDGHRQLHERREPDAAASGTTWPSRPKVEAALALGATSRQAVSPILKTALRGALVPLVDATKTTGIIFLPGAMVGMIIAGADPLEAVELQIVVLYMLLGSVSVAAMLVGLLSYRSFFTARHQLRVMVREDD